MLLFKNYNRDKVSEIVESNKYTYAILVCALAAHTMLSFHSLCMCLPFRHKIAHVFGMKSKFNYRNVISQFIAPLHIFYSISFYEQNALSLARALQDLKRGQCAEVFVWCISYISVKLPKPCRVFILRCRNGFWLCLCGLGTLLLLLLLTGVRPNFQSIRKCMNSILKHETKWNGKRWTENPFVTDTERKSRFHFFSVYCT